MTFKLLPSKIPDVHYALTQYYEHLNNDIVTKALNNLKKTLYMY